jgi:hypothetical protein
MDKLQTEREDACQSTQQPHVNPDRAKLRLLADAACPPLRADATPRSEPYPALRCNSYVNAIPPFATHCPDEWKQLCAFVPRLSELPSNSYGFHFHCLDALLLATSREVKNQETYARMVQLLVRLMHVWHHEIGESKIALRDALYEEQDPAKLVVLVDAFGWGLDPALWTDWKRDPVMSMSYLGALTGCQINLYQNMLSMHHLVLQRSTVSAPC